MVSQSQGNQQNLCVTRDACRARPQYAKSTAVNMPVELHRVLKSTGSIYLHCDPTASHYLKLLMDAVFGPATFRNEISWRRTGAHNSAKPYGPVHDIVLYYTKSDDYCWNPIYVINEEYVAKRYTYTDDQGRSLYPVSLLAAGTRRGWSGMPWRGIDVTAKGNH